MKRALFGLLVFSLTASFCLGAVRRGDGPVAFWGGENNARDSIGGNHGEIVGGVTFVPGVRGRAFRFDGQTGFIRVPNDPSLQFTNALSIEMWFKRDDDASYGGLIDKRNYTQCNYGIIMSQDWQFQVYYNDPNYQNFSGWYEISFSPVPTAGRFHYVVGTFEQIEPDRVQLKTYMDGDLMDTVVWPGNLSATLHEEPLAIGAVRNGSDSFFKGVIDEVALYDRALSAREVHARYHSVKHLASSGNKIVVAGHVGR